MDKYKSVCQSDGRHEHDRFGANAIPGVLQIFHST